MTEIEGTIEGESERVDSKGGKMEKGRIVEDRLMEIEGRMEMRERKEIRKNINNNKRGGGEGNRRKAMEEILKVIGVKAEMEEIRKLGGEEEKSGKILLIKLKDKVQKREKL